MGMKNSDAAFKQRVIAENQILDSHTSSLAPAVDITFSKPASAVKGSFRTGLRFRKLRGKFFPFKRSSLPSPPSFHFKTRSIIPCSENTLESKQISQICHIGKVGTTIC